MMKDDAWHIGNRVEGYILGTDRQKGQADAQERVFRSPALPFMGRLPRLSKAQLPCLHHENKD